ncbi:MAG: hypothetical protein R3Y55_03795 [Rikenellaceae bacterium]
METYEQLKDRQTKEVNDFPMGFAFSEKQFEEVMEKLGLKPTDTDKVVRLGSLGGFCRKDDAKSFHEMFARHDKEMEDAIAADTTGDGFIYEMFLYELKNYEYCVAFSAQTTLEALGISRKRIAESPSLSHGFHKARREEEAWAEANGFM